MKAYQIARENDEYMRALRREFHRLPELSLQEKRTSLRIRDELDQLGIPYVTVGQYGIIATITGTRSDRVVALRADIDALPIEEANSHLDFKSEVPGVMHACGHDGHAAMLLGAARILVAMRDELFGTVKLCFQQAEEVGEGTAEILAELSKFPVETFFGIHLWSELATGTISVEAGPRMAAGQAFDIRLQGVSTHGAYPNRGVDPIIAASALVMNCAALVSREFDPADPVALTFGQIHGGEANNVIPSAVQLSGTIRSTRPETDAYLQEAMTRVVQMTAQTYRTTAEISFSGKVSVVRNDETCSAIAERAVNVLGLEDRLGRFNTIMASENYADFLDVYPGVFALIGVRNEAIGACYPHHHPNFNIDEEPLASGAALHAQYAIEYLRSNARPAVK